MVSRCVRSHPGRLHLVRSTRNTEGDQAVVGGDAKHRRVPAKRSVRIGQDQLSPIHKTIDAQVDCLHEARTG